MLSQWRNLDNVSESFLRSFVERIAVNDSDVKLIYTIPIPPEDHRGKAWEFYLSYRINGNFESKSTIPFKNFREDLPTKSPIAIRKHTAGVVRA